MNFHCVKDCRIVKSAGIDSFMQQVNMLVKPVSLVDAISYTSTRLYGVSLHKMVLFLVFTLWALNLTYFHSVSLKRYYVCVYRIIMEQNFGIFVILCMKFSTKYGTIYILHNYREILKHTQY